MSITISQHHIVTTSHCLNMTWRSPMTSHCLDLWHHIVLTSHYLNITWRHYMTSHCLNMTWRHYMTTSSLSITISQHHIVTHDDITWHHIVSTWHYMTSLFYIFSCWQSHLMSVFKQSFTENIPLFLQLAHFWFCHWQVLARPVWIELHAIVLKLKHGDEKVESLLL